MAATFIMPYVYNTTQFEGIPNNQPSIQKFIDASLVSASKAEDMTAPTTSTSSKTALDPRAPSRHDNAIARPFGPKQTSGFASAKNPPRVPAERQEHSYCPPGQ